MSLNALAWALQQELPDPTLQLILIRLANYANPDTGEAWPSIATLAKRCAIAPRTLNVNLEELVRRGLVERLPRYRESGAQTSNAYRFPPLMVVTPPAVGGTPPPAEFDPPEGGAPPESGFTPPLQWAAPPEEQTTLAKPPPKRARASCEFATTPAKLAPRDMAKVSNGGGATAKLRRPLPADWTPNPVTNVEPPFTPAELEHEAKQFRIHHTLHQSEYPDWDLAWMGWLLREVKHKAKTNGHTNGQLVEVAAIWVAVGTPQWDQLKADRLARGLPSPRPMQSKHKPGEEGMWIRVPESTPQQEHARA